MNIAFKIIKTGSGNDIYFQNLAQGLKNAGQHVDFYYYPKICQYFPFLMQLMHRHTNSDVVHANIEYAWAVKESGKPLVATVHHLVFDREFQKFTSLPQKLFHYLILWPNTYLSIKAADKIVSVSQYTNDCLDSCFGKQSKSMVIYNGIDVEMFKPVKVKSYTGGKFHLLFVGNLIRRKGADLLPQIMEQLGEDYVLHYTSGLRTKTPKGFERANMQPLGKLSPTGLVEAYNKCDALLFPTRLEGFGYAVVEAMACGKPVAISSNSSLPELIDKNCGMEFSTNNISSIVKAVKLVVSKTYDAQHTRQRVIKLFSMKDMLQKYQDLYMLCIESR